MRTHYRPAGTPETACGVRNPRHPVCTGDAITCTHCRGYFYGEQAGTWVFDGNSTTRDYEAALRGVDEGDPLILDQLPGCPVDVTYRFAVGWTFGMQDEVARTARRHLEQEEEEEA